MSKRRPGLQLTHDNWDDEEETEEAGEFARANKNVLKSREIKVARRRTANTEGEPAIKKAFAGFGGFSSSLAGKGFSFAALGGTKTLGGLSNGQSKDKTDLLPSKTVASSSVAGTSLFNPASKNEVDKEKYLQKLKALNECVSKWIKQHVDKNPYCILTPIFKDYEKHLNEVERLNPEKTDCSKNSDTLSASESSFGPAKNKSTNADVNSATDDSSSSPFPVPPSDKSCMFPVSPGNDTKSDKPIESGFKFTTSTSTNGAQKNFSFSSGINSQDNANSSTGSTLKSFSFAASSSTDTSNSKPLFGKNDSSSVKKPFSFAIGSGTSGGSSGVDPSNADKHKFSFGVPASSSESSTNVKPFSFAVIPTSSTENTTTNTDEDDDDYEPPKSEVVEIQEEDAIYSKRCKLYYQSDGEWKEKGVGNAYLKPTKDGKCQFLIRAETTLGNILLNILLTKSIPFNRQGKNSVTFMCIPSPPINPKNETKGYTMLLRLKTAEEADEFLGKIEENKN